MSAQPGAGVVTLDSVQAAVKQELAYNDNVPLAWERNTIITESVDHQRMPTVSWNTEGVGQTHVITPVNEDLARAFPKIPHFSFTSALNLDYLIYDGGVTKSVHAVNDREFMAELKEIEVQLSSHERLVNDLYYSALMKESEARVYDVNIQILEDRIEAARVGEEYGTVLPGSTLRLEIEQDKLRSRAEEARADANINKILLEDLSGMQLRDRVEFEPVIEIENAVPELPVQYASFSDSIERPEVELLTLKQQSIMAQQDLAANQNKVKLQLFASGGLGYPNPLNFFNIKVEPYAIGGLRLIVPLFDWNETTREQDQLRLVADGLEVEKRAFLDQVEQERIRYAEEARKAVRLAAYEADIVVKEERILEDYQLMLEQGVIKSHEYTEQLNSVLEAQLRLETRRLSISYIIIQYLTTCGQFPDKN